MGHHREPIGQNPELVMIVVQHKPEKGLVRWVYCTVKLCILEVKGNITVLLI